MDQKADSNTRRLLRECKELLKELGEACDGLLPKAWPVSVCAAEAPKMLHGGVMDFCIEAVELQGSSVAESDGVYEPSRKVSNGFPVFENRFGFQLSMEVQATKAGDVSAGWIVGRKNVGFFGTRQLLSNQFPSNDWHCFPAASKESAPTECSVKTTQLEENLGWGHWARLGNYGGPAEAARILPACVNRLGRGGDVRRAAWALTDPCQKTSPLRLHPCSLSGMLWSVQLFFAFRNWLELFGSLGSLLMLLLQQGRPWPLAQACHRRWQGGAVPCVISRHTSVPLAEQSSLQAYLELACCLQHQGQKDEADIRRRVQQGFGVLDRPCRLFPVRPRTFCSRCWRSSPTTDERRKHCDRWGSSVQCELAQEGLSRVQPLAAPMHLD